MSAKPNTSLNERTKHSSSTFMVSVSVPSMSNITRCMGKQPNEKEISHGTVCGKHAEIASEWGRWLHRLVSPIRDIRPHHSAAQPHFVTQANLLQLEDAIQYA